MTLSFMTQITLYPVQFNASSGKKSKNLNSAGCANSTLQPRKCPRPWKSLLLNPTLEEEIVKLRPRETDSNFHLSKPKIRANLAFLMVNYLFVTGK